jgi:VWFA-related protein
MIQSSSHTRLGATLVLACLLLSASWSPAVSQSLPEGGFSETINVDLVNVEVWVSDQEGNPIASLDRDAFTLLHDGTAMPISHFSAIRESVPSDTLSGDTQPSPSPDSQAHLAVVFDLLHLTADSQKRLARELEEFLADGPIPAEHVLILRLEAGLSIEAPFGSTADDLSAALKRLEKRQTSATDLSAELKQVVRALQDTWTDLNSQANTSSIRSRVNLVIGPTASQGASATSGGTGGAVGSGGVSTGVACEDFVDRVEPIVVGWGKKEIAKTRASLNRLADTASFLSGLDGPKTLLYLSDGLGMAPGASATSFVRGLCPNYKTDLEVDTLPDELKRSFLQLTRDLNANRITLHTIQGPGAEEALGGTTSQASSDRRGVRGFQKSLRTNGRQGLALLADETGGRAVASSTDLDRELRRIGYEMSSYYSLAYSPPPSESRDHQIEVRVVDDSLQARYRRSYSDKTPDQWLTERLESALYLGLVANPLAIRLAAGQITPTIENRYTLPLHIRVPVERLTFSTPDGQPMSQLKIKVMGLNTSSRSLVMTDRSMSLPRPDGKSGKILDLGVDIELEGGVQVVAIAVRDEASGEASFVSTTMRIGPSES